MSLFKKSVPEPEPPRGGGKDIIRAMVRNRIRTPQALSLLREELRVSNDTISAFAAGGDMTAEQIGRVLAHFGWNARYDPERDLLVSTAPPAKPLGIAPAPLSSAGVNLPPGMAPREAGKLWYEPPLYKTPQPGPALKGYTKPAGWA